jgi:hypothetical protein
VPDVNANDIRIYAAAAGAFLVIAVAASWIAGRRSWTMATTELLRLS